MLLPVFRQIFHDFCCNLPLRPSHDPACPILNPSQKDRLLRNMQYKPLETLTILPPTLPPARTAFLSPSSSVSLYFLQWQDFTSGAAELPFLLLNQGLPPLPLLTKPSTTSQIFPTFLLSPTLLLNKRIPGPHFPPDLIQQITFHSFHHLEHHSTTTAISPSPFSTSRPF